MDLIDLFAGKANPAASKTSAKKEEVLELLTEFLILVSDDKMAEAYALSEQILLHDPRNAMISEYREVLRSYIDQTNDSNNAASEEEEEDAESEEEEDNSGDDSDDSDEEEKDDLTMPAELRSEAKSSAKR